MQLDIERNPEADTNISVNLVFDTFDVINHWQLENYVFFGNTFIEMVTVVNFKWSNFK